MRVVLSDHFKWDSSLRRALIEIQVSPKSFIGCCLLCGLTCLVLGILETS